MPELPANPLATRDYYLNNAVNLVEDFLSSANPLADAVVDYGYRDAHCWNGDHTHAQ